MRNSTRKKMHAEQDFDRAVRLYTHPPFRDESSNDIYDRTRGDKAFGLCCKIISTYATINLPPLPKSLVLYRGVSGTKSDRHLGLSWTTSLPVAAHFATAQERAIQKVDQTGKYVPPELISE